MAERNLKVKVKLRRDTEAYFESVKDTLVLLKGEVVIVETASNGLRIKVGDGSSTYSQLEFIDENLIGQINNIVVRGYYHNGRFYTDTTYKEAYVGYEYKVYIDRATNDSYSYDDSSKQYYKLINIPTATSTQAGIMKLYSDLGSNTDGAVDQNRVTTEINKKFEVSAGDDETLIFI